MSRRAVALSAVLLLGWTPVVGPARVGAQTVRGRLLEDGTERPIVAGLVMLIGEEGDTMLTAQTDTSGWYEVRARGPGRYRLAAQRIGYRSAFSPLFLLRRRVLELDLLMTVSAVPVDPVSVTVRSRRVEEYRQLGGRWVGRDRIERVLGRARHVGDVLRWESIPGLNVREVHAFEGETLPSGVCIEAGRKGVWRGIRCHMIAVYVDDVRVANPQVFLMNLDPEFVQSMVFLRSSEAGVRYGGGSGNGVLLIFTRGYIP